MMNLLLCLNGSGWGNKQIKFVSGYLECYTSVYFFPDTQRKDEGQLDNKHNLNLNHRIVSCKLNLGMGREYSSSKSKWRPWSWLMKCQCYTFACDGVLIYYKPSNFLRMAIIQLAGHRILVSPISVAVAVDFVPGDLAPCKSCNHDDADGIQPHTASYHPSSHQFFSYGSSFVPSVPEWPSTTKCSPVTQSPKASTTHPWIINKPVAKAARCGAIIDTYAASSVWLPSLISHQILGKSNRLIQEQ